MGVCKRNLVGELIYMASSKKVHKKARSFLSDKNLHFEEDNMNCGIMGIGTYVPNCWMTARDISLQSGIPEDVIVNKFGIVKKPIPGAKDTPSYMGIQAARIAIENAGITPQELDAVIWVGGQNKDHIIWLAGVKVAEEIGAKNAWAFDLSSLCGSMMSGLEIGKSLLLSSHKYNTILLVSGFRDGDFVNLSVPETSFLFDVSAGGAAVVIRKNYNRNVILGSSFKCDGTISDECVVKDFNSQYFTVKDNTHFRNVLKEKTNANFLCVVKEALKDSDLQEPIINYLAVCHVSRAAHDNYLKNLALTNEQTTYLDQYGHMGQNDQILSIELGLKSGKIKEGSNIVLVGIGLGFIWAATVVKWGRLIVN
jgi:3-oxoacyl-[acyl-carrier-protein] synthase-3